MNFAQVFISLLLSCIAMLAQANSDLEKVTNKVYFDVEIGGQAAGRLF